MDNNNFAWDDIEEVEPDEDEKRIFAAYEAGDPDYQPYMTHEQIKSQLGL